MKTFSVLFAVLTLSTSFAFADSGQAKATDSDTQSTGIEITGPAAKKLYLELTNPLRTDSYDAEGGIEVFISVGKNMVCTYATTNPEQYSCKLTLNKATGEANLKQ